MEIICIETTIASGKRIQAGSKYDVSEKDAKYLFSLNKAMPTSEKLPEGIEAIMKGNMASAKDIEVKATKKKKED